METEYAGLMDCLTGLGINEEYSDFISRNFKIGEFPRSVVKTVLENHEKLKGKELGHYPINLGLLYEIPAHLEEIDTDEVWNSAKKHISSLGFEKPKIVLETEPSADKIAMFLEIFALARYHDIDKIPDYETR